MREERGELVLCARWMLSLMVILIMFDHFNDLSYDIK